MNEEDVSESSMAVPVCHCFDPNYADWLLDATPVEVVAAAIHIESMVANHNEAHTLAEEIIRRLLH